MAELPKYKSKREVQGGKVTSIVPLRQPQQRPHGARLTVGNGDNAVNVEVEQDFMERFVVEVGGFYVVDTLTGWESFLSPEGFEEEFTPVKKATKKKAATKKKEEED